MAAFDGNGRTADCLARARRWFSLSNERVPQSIKLALRAVDTDYALEGAATAAGARYVRPGRAHPAHVADPEDGATCTWALVPRYSAGAGRRLGVRLRALSAVAPAGNATDLLLLGGGGTAAGPGAVVRSNTSCIITDYYFLQTGLNYSVTDAPAGGPTSALRLGMNANSTNSTRCLRTQFSTPLDLSNNRVIAITVHGDGSGAVLDIQVEDALGNLREFFVALVFTGWKTIRLALPAGRELYTHAGGPIPRAFPGHLSDNGQAMRYFSWSKITAVTFEMTNTTQTTAFIGKLEALAETAATTAGGATLTVGGSTLTLPVLRGDMHTDADYVECDDVTNASSCLTYDANNWLLNHTTKVAQQKHTASAGDGGRPSGPIALDYAPGARAKARVEVVVFEWAGDADRLGSF
jgi:hypothetical protein